MKLLIAIIFSSLIINSSYCQTDRVDSLISKINNRNLVDVCNYFCKLVNKGEQAETLISLGKASPRTATEIYNKLYALLTDTSKGIISHYVLSNIAYADKISFNSFNYQDSDETFEYEYNYLRFYQKNYNGIMFTDANELEQNKKRWTTVLKMMKVLN